MLDEGRVESGREREDDAEDEKDDPPRFLKLLPLLPVELPEHDLKQKGEGDVHRHHHRGVAVPVVLGVVLVKIPP